MIFIGIINIVWALVVWLMSKFVQFHDAEKALTQGIFSATSVSHTSITKIVFLFCVYIVGSAVIAWVFKHNKAVAETADAHESWVGEPLVVPNRHRVPQWEKVIVILVIAGAFILPFVTRERYFDSTALLNEDFFTAAAATTLRAPPLPSGYPLYPYALGPIIMFNAFGATADAAVWVVALMSALALAGIYLYVRYTVSSARERVVYYGLFIGLFHYLIIFPSFHRNMLRLAVPLFAAGMFLWWAERRNLGVRASLVWLSLVWLGIWFFSSADTAIVAGVLFCVAVASVVITQRRWKLVTLVSAPIIGLLLLYSIFPTTAHRFMTAQYQSLFAYASHFNAVPYVPEAPSGSVAGWVQWVITVGVMFAPWLLLGNVVMFLVWSYRAQALVFTSKYGFLLALTMAYTIGFRQNFGEAGFSRITLTSFLILCAFPIIRSLARRVVYARYVTYGYWCFFIGLMVIAVYFNRYSFADAWHRRAAQLTRTDVIPCANTALGIPLRRFGYTRCDPASVQELTTIRDRIGNSHLFVFDDLPALYYLFERPAVAIAPSLSMAYREHAILANALDNDKIDYIVVAASPHFFGVPLQYVQSPLFMPLFKQEIAASQQVYQGALFSLYKRK